MNPADPVDTPLETEETSPPTPPLPTPPVDEPVPALPATTGDEVPKSPILAMLLAFIPFGLGHLYLGLYNRALMFFGAFWFSIYLEAAVFAFFFYFFTIIDAFRQAQLINIHGVDGQEPVKTGKGAMSLGVFLLVVGTVLLLRNWIDIDQIRYFLRDYSPVLLILAGCYFIFDAIKERSRGSESDYETDL